jgi:hydroxymethylglutaryl-CoA synthase
VEDSGDMTADAPSSAAVLAPPTPVAVLGVGVGAPALRLPAREVAAAWGAGGGKHTVALCDSDEDTLTLAWSAALDALDAAGVAAEDVSGLWWGTTRPPFAEGPSHAFLATALGLNESAGGALTSGSPHAGMEALVAAWDALAAGHAQLSLVVASDALVPGLGTAGEATTGAGAVALVLAAEPAGANGAAPAARLLGRATRRMAVVDRYRGDAQDATGDVYDGRLFREEVFLPLVTSAGSAVAGGAGAGAGGRGRGAIAGWSIGDLDGKLGAAAARSLGAPLVSAPVTAALGDAGAAAALLGSLPALAGDGGTIGVVGYGGGRASAVVVDVARAVPGAAAALARLDGGRVVTYTEAAKARGQLVPMVDPIPMGVPPASAAFVRGAVEMLSLEGALCASCGTISTPPSIHPRCVGCGSADTAAVRLARRGRVETFVVNQTMPPPFQAPLPLIVIDLEDGARLMLQGSPADAEVIGIGDTVDLHLRRYAVERHIPVYGYKALRAAGVASAEEGSRR